MGIYNLNPRRVVWFSPNEPSNKYDIWLSRNAHLDENGEPTTDSNSQRDCDYIFKIYDCGKWNPIVGFNSTAANKIDTVTGADYTIDGVTHSGKEVYHPAIFTAESPNELYDAGTLGSLLSNPNFVSELEWYYLFNSTNYSWDNIFGDTNWFGDLIWETIQGGSSTYHLPWATTETCGGILSDIHTYNAASAFKPIEVKFYPTTNMYSLKLHRLCVSASDVIDQINSYYNDNPSSLMLTIPLATYERIGGARIQTDTTTLDYRGVPVLFGGPNTGLTYGSNTPEGLILYGDSVTYNPDNSFLYVPAWAIMDIIKNPTGSQTPESMIRNGFGTFAQWLHDEHADLDYCTVSIKATPNVDKGKFLKIKEDGSDIEFTDVFTNSSTITLNYSSNKEKLDIRHKQSDSSNVVFAFNIYNGTTLVEENERRTGTSTNVIVLNGACNIVFGNQGGNTPTPLYIKLAVASGASCSINYDFSDLAIHQVINPIKTINNENGSLAAIYFITIQIGIVKFEEVTVITTSAE